MALNDQERRVCDRLAARGDELLHQLAEHVAIPTGTGHEPGLRRYRELLVERLKTLGAVISMHAACPRPEWLTLPGDDAATGESAGPIVEAHGPRPAPGPRVLLAGHLDTVHDPKGPFQRLEIDQGGARAVGPGAVDMKGGVLIAIAALEALRDAGVPVAWTVLLNCDEETGSLGSFGVLKAVAAEHDVGIALEPALAGGELAIERMGAGQFKVEVHGRGAHVGREFERGVSAVTALGELLGRLAALSDPAGGMIVNVGPLTGGTVTNAVPDSAACWGNLRFADAETGRRLVERLDALATADDAMPRVVVHHALNRPAKPQTDAVREMAETARACAKDLGQALPFASTGGVCDGNILQDAGLPTIDTLGVRGGNLHRTDEFVEIRSLVERSQLLAVLLMRLAGAS